MNWIAKIVENYSKNIFYFKAKESFQIITKTDTYFRPVLY